MRRGQSQGGTLGEHLMTCGGNDNREAGGAGGQWLPGLGGEGDRTGAFPAMISPGAGLIFPICPPSVPVH